MKQSLANAFSILYNYNIYILISCRKFNRTLDTLCENPRAINQDSLNIEGLIADHINIFSLETIGQHS